MRANPKDENVLSLLAFMAESSGRLELALGALNDLIAANPSSQDYRLKRMVMYVSGGDFFQAEAECRELLRINPLRRQQGWCSVCAYTAQGRKRLDAKKSISL
jgi:tetratricopeptide (TPR) repeat protein